MHCNNQRIRDFLGSALIAFCFSGCGGGGDAAAGKPTAALSATPQNPDYNGTVTLTWSTTNTSQCSAEGPWSGPIALSGSETLHNLLNTATYFISCSGSGGAASASVKITVKPPPLPTIAFNPTASVVALAGADSLNWTATDATECIASDGWTGVQALSGSFQIGPVTKQTTYTLTCDGLGGSTSHSVTVGVSSTLPPAAPIATLAPGVLVFVGPVLQQGPDYVTFSGDQYPILPGQVFVLGGTAYKVTTAQITTGDPALFPPDFIPMPVIQVMTVPPAMDELFSQIDISGTYALDASAMVSQSAAARAQSSKQMQLSRTSRPAAAALIPLPLNLDFPPLEIHGTSNLALQATANIHYSKAGGFTNSSVVVNTSAQASVTVTSTIALSQTIRVPAGHFRIPIPLTVIDGQSNLVAVTAAAMDVPVSVVANPSIAYGLSYDANLQGSTSTNVTIANGGALSDTISAGAGPNTISISGATASPTATTPTSTVLGASLFAGIDLSSSLQLMNSVNLVTVDGRIGDRFKSDLTVLTAGSSPTYCGGYLGDLEFQGSSSLILSSNAFTAPVASSLVSELATLTPQPYRNYCGTQPIVTAAPSTPEVLLTPLSVGVNVVPPPPSGGPPPVAPTGAVRLTVDAASCDATIDTAGSGSCNLTPTTPGMRTLTSQYLGDSNFSPGSIVAQPLDVTLEQPLVSLALTPNPASYASVMTFTFNVSPSTGSSAQPTPTGSVTVLGFNNALCSSVIDNQGHGSCSYQMMSIAPLL